MESKAKCKVVDIIIYFHDNNNTTTTSTGTGGYGNCNSNSLLKAQNLNTYKAADIVNLYLPPILIVMGVFFNVLSILVMRSPYFRKVSISIYLTAGAVNDVMGLVLALLPHWIFVNYSEVYPRGAVTDDLCKFFNFYGFSNTDVTLSLTACMTADRAYAIKFPLRVASMSTVRRARYIIVVGVLVVMVKNFHLWFASAMSPPEGTERLCIVSTSEEGPDFTFYVEKVCPWVHILFLFICLLVIVLSNIVIIVHVKRSARLNDVWHTNAASARRGSPSHSITSAGRLRQMTTMMLTESFTTLILSCPFAWYTHYADSDPNLHKDPDKLAMNQLLFSVFFYMLYSNKCVNFFLYFVSGYKFRLALRQLLRCYCRDCSSGGSSNNNSYYNHHHHHHTNNNNAVRDLSIFTRPRGRAAGAAREWRSEVFGSGCGDRRESAFNNNNNWPSVRALGTLTKNNTSSGTRLLATEEAENRHRTGLDHDVDHDHSSRTTLANGHCSGTYYEREEEAEEDGAVSVETAQRSEQALGKASDHNDDDDSSWDVVLPSCEGTLSMIASTNTVSTMVGDILNEPDAGSVSLNDNETTSEVSQPDETPTLEQSYVIEPGQSDVHGEVSGPQSDDE